MELTEQQRDRAGGVLLGQAIGDALGVPYEFAPRIRPGDARMKGGGLGPYAPGEWSDDTQMAICIARVSATGARLTSPEALDAIAVAFLDWQTQGASDIGNQTASVLTASRGAQGSPARAMTRIAEHEATTGRAGNGALMRTGIVGVSALGDRQRTADAATAVSALTHPDTRCIDACILWSAAVREAVLTGTLDVRAGLDLVDPERRAWWESVLAEAETADPDVFSPNGYTVTALQAAWSSIYATATDKGPGHVERALQRAISIGDDTDTVAAIAGALLGARYGVAGLPADLARRVHGWPGMAADDLVQLAVLTATGEIPTK